MTWSVGDKCQAIYSGDHKPYKATITSIIDDSTVDVVFDEYNTNQVTPITDLKASNVKYAYKVGDMVKAIYSGDQLAYRARIESVATDEDGNEYCEVLFVEYDHKEAVWISDVLPYDDEETAEVSQKPDAAKEEVIAANENETPVKSDICTSVPVIKDESCVAPETKKNYPDWTPGEDCIYIDPEKSGSEIRGRIIVLQSESESGDYFAGIELVDGRKVTAWVDTLKKVDTAMKTDSSLNAPLSVSTPTKCESPVRTKTPEPVKPAALDKISKAFTSKADPSKVDTCKMSTDGSVSNASTSSSGAKSSANCPFKIGDYCQALTGKDQKPLEALVMGIEKDTKTACLKILGCDTIERVAFSKLFPSKGAAARSDQIASRSPKTTSEQETQVGNGKSAGIDLKNLKTTLENDINVASAGAVTRHVGPDGDGKKQLSEEIRVINDVLFDNYLRLEDQIGQLQSELRNMYRQANNTISALRAKISKYEKDNGRI